MLEQQQKIVLEIETFYNDESVNPAGRYKNYMHICNNNEALKYKKQKQQ